MEDPKEFTKKAFRSSGKYLSEVLRHYWKHMNYYKKEKTNPPATFEEATEIFSK